VSASILQLKNVSKSFGGVAALKQLTLELAAGEVLGLVGENGAGKSTLIRLLSGVYQPDAGTIRWLGEPVRFATPREAIGAGIATIHQELAYCGTLTVAENLMLGQVWPRRAWGGVDWQRLYRDSAEILARFDIAIRPDQLFHDLRPAQRQEVAIARALSQRARLVILDEPTASLSEREVEELFGHMARLRSAGVTIIYVSHRLDEILRLTNRVAVLRDGALIATYPTREADAGRLVADMVGRPLTDVYPRTRSGQLGPVLLALHRASRRDLFEDISFELRAGEIVGLAGLVGAGRSELARAIYGLYPLHSGSMQLRGSPWRPSGPDAALKAGLIYVPEERKRQGFVLDHTVGESIGIGFSDLLIRWGLIGRRTEAHRIQHVLDTYTIRARDRFQAIGTLSGGNQQKSLLGRWLERGPEVIILDEPTRGVDVGAKAEIHALIDRLAAEGRAVLLISSDLPEVLGMSDRLLVLRRGSVSVELTGKDITQANVLLAASGMYRGDSKRGTVV
jgi:ABC-type sugar transport system ATPase subunit